MSKKNTLAAAIMLYLDDTFEEEEVIQITMDQNRKNPSIPFWKYSHVESTLGDMSEEELKVKSRFGSGEIDFPYEAQRIPQSFTYQRNCCHWSGRTVDVLEALHLSVSSR